MKNSKMSFLPSTGGVGTTIFAIVGVVFVAAALCLHMILEEKASWNRTDSLR
ncbi:MAG: LPXTG cell wall anchor domain-containing protein [Eubacterium sp.]